MIDEFLQYIQYEKNYSSHTVLSYHKDLSQFCEFLQLEEVQFKPDKVDVNDIRQWILSLMSAGDSARTISRKISTLKSFWRFLRVKGYVLQNPTSKIILPKTNKPLPAFFKEKEMDAALDETFLPDSFEAVRNHLILELFYLTGIRLSELIGIRDVDVDLAGGSLKVTGKRNKQRIVPLSMEFCRKLQNYIAERDDIFDDREDGRLFVLSSGKKLYPKMLYNLVHNTMSQFSNASKKSPHVLRHTFATGLLNEGADINAVKELLGHTSLAATQVYTHTSFEELNNIYKHAHPRAK